MKEASGEASMTAITIILVGVIAAVAIPLVRNSMTGVSDQACCTSAGGYLDDQGACVNYNEAVYKQCAKTK